MTKQKITALRQALSGPPGPHLDQQQLAELATAEAAGEPVEERYPAALAHLEQCLPCAQSYSELVSLALSAAEKMAAAAAAVPPEAVYTAFLQQAAPDAPAYLLESLVAQLPLHFSSAPAAAADVPQELVQSAVSPLAPTWTTRLLQAVRQNLPALRLYLEQAAAAAWQQLADLRLDVNGRAYPLQLIPASSLREKSVPYTAGEPITVELTRLSPLAGRLTIRLQPTGDTAIAGRSLSLHYADQTQTITTDQQGIAHFEPIPLSAFPHLTIHLHP